MVVTCWATDGFCPEHILDGFLVVLAIDSASLEEKIFQKFSGSRPCPIESIVALVKVDLMDPPVAEKRTQGTIKWCGFIDNIDEIILGKVQDISAEGNQLIDDQVCSVEID